TRSRSGRRRRPPDAHAPRPRPAGGRSISSIVSGEPTEGRTAARVTPASLAAADGNHFAVDVGRGIRDDEGDHGRDLLGGGETADRVALENTPSDLLVSPKG